MKPKVKITVSEIEKINDISKEINHKKDFGKTWIKFLEIHRISYDNRSKLENIYDKLSTFLFGAKSFKWGELKGL